MNFEQIMPAAAMILVLILVLPGFLSSNSNLKTFLKNISIWAFICYDSSILPLLNEKNKFSYNWLYGENG